MYKFVVVSVFALVILQGTLAKPKIKQGTTQNAEKSQIDELAAQARQIVQNVSQAIEGKLPDSKQVSNTLTETSQAFATKVKSVVDDLTKQAQDHKGDIENVINSVKDRLKATASELQTAIGPEATKNVKEIKANLDDTLKKVITEAERLAKAAQPEVGKIQNDLNTSAKNLLDWIVDAGKKVQEELNKNTAPTN